LEENIQSERSDLRNLAQEIAENETKKKVLAMSKQEINDMITDLKQQQNDKAKEHYAVNGALRSSTSELNNMSHTFTDPKNKKRDFISNNNLQLLKAQQLQNQIVSTENKKDNQECEIKRLQLEKSGMDQQLKDMQENKATMLQKQKAAQENYQEFAKELKTTNDKMKQTTQQIKEKEESKEKLAKLMLELEHKIENDLDKIKKKRRGYQ